VENAIEKTKLRNKQLTDLFNSLQDEITLIKVSAKFDLNLNKISEKEYRIKTAYIEDTKKIAELLKERMKLLWETTN
jgi:hypothetical protein